MRRVREGDWGVTGLNTAIERELIARKRLVKDGPWHAYRPVMVTRNDSALGVFNGDIGITLPSPDGPGVFSGWRPKVQRRRRGWRTSKPPLP